MGRIHTSPAGTPWNPPFSAFMQHHVFNMVSCFLRACAQGERCASTLVGAVPRQSWLGPAAGFGGVGGPSPFLAEGPVGVVPRHS